jgi:hypothetical protein
LRIGTGKKISFEHAPKRARSKKEDFEMSRKRGSSQFSFTVLVLAIVCLAAGIAAAQTEPADTYYVNYYSNAFAVGPRSATVHIVNPGTAITSVNRDGLPTSGDLCANIFMYNNDEQAVECCSCRLSPDSERTLAINGNLLNNPVQGANVTPDGVIKIISTAPIKGTCPLPTGDVNIAPTAGLRAWDTHIQLQNTDPVSHPETEEEFASAPLSSFELEFNELECSAIATSGSKAGICACGYGD